jgi:LuxR family transcriptional regulator, maltose regulon positive regulatory protein
VITRGEQVAGEFLTPLPGASLALISPPPVVPHFLYRKNLIELLSRPAPRTTFIIAPNGFGKTALAAQWAAQEPEITMWVTIDSAFTPKDLAVNVISAIRRVVPNFAPWAEKYFLEDLDLSQLVIDVANEIGKIPQTLRMVWDGPDDLSEENVPLIQIFINNAPLNLNMVSIRKTLPTVSHARAASLDALSFLNAADLKFSHEEVALLAEQNGLDIHNANIMRVLSYAEGWPTAVQMLCNEISKKGISEFSGAKDLSMNHSQLVSSAVRNLPESDRLFLQEIVFFDTFSAVDVTEISSALDIEIRLRRLSDEGIFLNRTSDAAGQYFINSLIKEALKADLLKNPEKFKAIAAKTAGAIEKSDNPLPSIELYQLIGQTEKAVEIAIKNLARMIYMAENDLINKWAKPLGQLLGIGEAGELGLRIYADVAVGEVETVKPRIAELETMMESFPETPGTANEILLMKSRLAFSIGDFANAIAIYKTVTIVRNSNEVGFGPRAMSGVRPALDSAFLLEDTKTFRELAKLIEAEDHTNTPAMNLITRPVARTMSAIVDGRFRDAYELGLAALENAKKIRSGGVYIPYAAAYCVADALREFGEEEKALKLIDEYLVSAIRFRQYPWVAAFHAKKALIYSQLGSMTQALSSLRNARESVASPRFHASINRVIDEHELLVRVVSDESDRIGELLSRMPMTVTTSAFTTTYMAKKNPSQARQVLGQYPDDCPRHSITKKLIYAETYSSHPPTAIEYLEQAVEVAIQNGVRNIFLQQSTQVKGLLLELATRKPTVYLEGLASDIRNQMNQVEHQGRGSENSLTKREVEILRRLSTGLPITHIAASLHISINTMKSHLKNVYRKLNVESRDQAVTRGKELLLL